MNDTKQAVLTDAEIRAQIDECSMMAFPLRWINFARAIESAVLSKLRAAQASAEATREVVGVTLDGCLETLFRVGEHLGINYAESRKQPGAPSDVYIKAIGDRVSQARIAALEEAAQVAERWATPEQRTHGSGGPGAAIRALKSAPATDACRTDVRRAQPKRSPYNASASLSEYGIFPECDAAQAPAKGADVTLPPMPLLIPVEHYEEQQAMREYARAAVLADRQQRGGGGVIAECWKVLHEAGLDRRHFDGPLPDAIRAALAAQPAASAEPEQYKTDDELGGVLAAIRHYGGQKWAEGRGVADDDLQNVRNAWDAVYERVQALAAHKPDHAVLPGTNRRWYACESCGQAVAVPLRADVLQCVGCKGVMRPVMMSAQAAHKPDGGDALRRLVDEKFTSGNVIPVERISITRAEYDAAISAQQRQGEGE